MKYQKGFSLVELMVAMTLSLFLLSGLVYSVLGDMRAYEVAKSTQSLVGKSRMAVQSLRLYLQQAGFRDLDELKQARQLRSEATSSWNWAAGQNLQGIDASVAFAGAKNGSDIIALRFFGSPQNNILDCDGDPVVTTQPFEVTLFVSVNDQLICRDISGDIVLDEGVEHLRVQYGNSDSTNLEYFDAADISDWGEVDRVQFAVLLSEEVSRSFLANNNSYQLFDREIDAAGDQRYRRVVAETVLIRNQGA